MPRKKVHRVTKVTKDHINENSIQDQNTVLRDLAKAASFLMDADTEAIAHRCRLPLENRRIYNALIALRDKGQVESYLNQRSDRLNQWRLTQKGWEAVGQKPPIWLDSDHQTLEAVV